LNNPVYSRLKSAGMWRRVVGLPYRQGEDTRWFLKLSVQWQLFTRRQERYHLPHLYAQMFTWDTKQYRTWIV